MKTTIKYKSYIAEYSDGIHTFSVTFQGTRQEMEEIQERCSGDCMLEIAGFEIIGNVKRNKVYQENGDIWCCDLSWTSNSSPVLTPDPLTEYGKKSSQLEGGLLSLPLESHPDYRTCWNHYLAAVSDITEKPAWYETATTPFTGDSNYRWIATLADLPSDGSFKKIADPQMPGVTNYDIATYVIRESVKCRTMNIAGNEVRGKLNRIVSPDYDFGIASKVGGNWKCDSANVSYDGKNWVAHLIYTLSGDEKGWDRRIYK